jgi:hypothetical protein
VRVPVSSEKIKSKEMSKNKKIAREKAFCYNKRESKYFIPVGSRITYF